MLLNGLNFVKYLTFERNYVECQRLDISCGVYYCKAVNTAEADVELTLLRKVLTGKTV